MSKQAIPSTRKRVLLAISTAGADGRARMAGIYRWLGEGHDWDEVILRTRADFTVPAIVEELERGLDGAIVGIPYNYDAGQLLVESDLPLAVTTSSLAEHLPADRPKTVYSLIDNVALGRAAAAQFRALGRFAAFAYVHDARNSSWSKERLDGFSVSWPNCRVLTGRLESDNTIDRLQTDKLTAFLSTLPHPTALLAANDVIAEQVLSACRTLTLRVPEDISVIGVDNDTFTCTATRPALSSLEPDFNEAGYRAAVMLDALMRGRAPRHWAKRPGLARFVPRDSTKTLSPATKLVQDATAFIEANVFSGITAADVIDHLRVSRSLANLRFRELTGKSIGQTLTERRLTECEHLLKTTNWPFHRIAKSVGYNSPDILRNLFRSRHGQGPTRWQKAACSPSS